jgi:hypothetical protein
MNFIDIWCQNLFPLLQFIRWNLSTIFTPANSTIYSEFSERVRITIEIIMIIIMSKIKLYHQCFNELNERLKSTHFVYLNARTEQMLVRQKQNKIYEIKRS